MEIKEKPSQENPKIQQLFHLYLIFAFSLIKKNENNPHTVEALIELRLRVII